MNETTEMLERIKAAEELEAIAKKLASINPKSRIMSLVMTKLEEAALWYAKLLQEPEE